MFVQPFSVKTLVQLLKSLAIVAVCVLVTYNKIKKEKAYSSIPCSFLFPSTDYCILICRTFLRPLSLGFSYYDISAHKHTFILTQIKHIFIMQSDRQQITHN